MNAKLRDIAIRFRSVLWLTAIALAAITEAGGPNLTDWLAIAIAVAVTASVNGAILDTHRDSMETLIRELAVVSRQNSGDPRPHLRQAR